MIGEGTDVIFYDEQGELRRGRGSMDQAFTVRQVYETYLLESKDVYWAFMDIETKYYDTINKEGLWSIKIIKG